MVNEGTIKLYACKFYEENGYVTTLELKTFMRNDGHEVWQRQVSDAMKALVQEGVFVSELAENWEWYSEEPFCIYFLAPKNQAPADDSDEEDEDEEVDVVTWKLFDYTGNGPTITMQYEYDRNRARAWYEKEYGVAYKNVGCNLEK